HRLRGARLASEARGRLPERHGRRRHRRREGLEVVTRIGLAGLGYWGPNLARNFDELAELQWLCDLSPQLLERFGRRSPDARPTTELDEMLDDADVEAVVIATPVPPHYDLARRALLAGKHVFVEKPPALRAGEVEELCALAQERDLVLMPGHVLLYHPAVK